MATVSTNKFVNAARQWIKWDPNDVTRGVVQKLVDAGDNDKCEALFGSRLEFGTAGLRGPMGAGSNRMNDLTVIQTTQGIVKYLFQQFGEERAKSMGFAVGYDHRAQAGCSSAQFAKYIAAVLLSKGIKVYLYEGIVATPLVPWCIEQKQCCAGVMVTASHNPKQDNGYKLYWNNGAQIIPPHDEAIAKLILENLQPWEAYSNIPDLRANPLCVDATEELKESYFKAIGSRLCRYPEDNKKSNVKITYTAMHGVGYKFTSQSFKAFGLPQPVLVEEQIHPDPEFPTVSFPNPEEGKGALALSFKAAEKNGSRVVLANDPDADRLAVAEMRADGTWKIFTGNELGTIFGHWQWSEWKKRNPETSGKDVYVICSTVSSKMLSAVARHEGFNFVETLTGFKWMGNETDRLRQQGKTVIFSFEEAIGFCIGDVVKDKDGVCAAAVCGEMIVQLYAKGMTVDGYLESLYKKYGYYVTLNSYVKCYQPPVVDAIFARMRNEGQFWFRCGAHKIKDIRDLTIGFDSTKPGFKPVLPVSSGSHMITYYFENGTVITFRTSGTEPKLKFYCELPGKDFENTYRVLEGLVHDVVEEMLQPDKNGLERRQE